MAAPLFHDEVGEADSSDFLAVSCSVYDEWNREVNVEARSGGFAGRSSAYFGVDRLRSFAAALDHYTLGSERPRLSSGFGVHSGTCGGDEITQEHVGIEVEQVQVNGQIGIAVHLATPDRAVHGRLKSTMSAWNS